MFSFTLPQHDRDPEARNRELESARQTYRYQYDWPPGVATAAEVPRADNYSLSYIAHLAPVMVELFRNAMGMAGHAVARKALEELVEAEIATLQGIDRTRFGQYMFEVHQRIAEHITSKQVDDPQEFGDLFSRIEPVPCWRNWTTDATFAWQRIAGVNPMLLRRIDEIPDHVAITGDVVSKSGHSLQAALKEGRAFACDYAVLDGAQCGATNERRKYLYAPYALFIAAGGTLHPVAIQRGQTPDTGVFTPIDGEEWALAKLAVQVADANYHEPMVHLGRTHMVMEAVALAAHRHFASSHPFYGLLLPHCAFTLPINHSAATSLIAPGGVIDHAFAGTIETSASLVRVALDHNPIRDANPVVDLAARGLMDTDVLPEHPYRDDALLVWRAIRDYAQAYVAYHYDSDADVVEDPELQAFVAELSSPEGGRLVGVDPVTNVDGLAQLVATLIWTATGQHSAVNFTQFPYMGAIPNIAGAFWNPWPCEDGSTPPLTEVLPPMNMALVQFNTVYQLSNLRVNYLGDYGMTHFLDPKVRGIVSDFQSALKTIETTISERDANRYLPYPHLLPSTIPNSIHI